MRRFNGESARPTLRPRYAGKSAMLPRAFSAGKENVNHRKLQMNKPPASALLLIVAGLTTAVFGLRDHNAGADPPSSGQGPDIMGLHMGMPLGEAVAVLKAYKSDFNFGFSYDGASKDNGRGADAVNAAREAKGGVPLGEQFALKGTWAPPHVLYSIERVGGGIEVGDRGVIVDALRKKYGPDIYHTDNLSGVYWLFDRQGRSLAGVKECAHLPVPARSSSDPCQGFLVIAHWAGSNWQAVGESINDAVVAKQEGLDAARRATERANEAQQKARDDLKRRTEQNMPKL